MPSFVAAIAHLATRQGVDLAALGLAWARVAPAVVLVPAFGAKAIPPAGRGLLALGMASILVPSVSPLVSDLPWEAAIGLEVVRGIPVALAAAIPLWAATVAGGLADSLRGSKDSRSSPVVEGRATPLGIPLSMFASAIFLTTGGPARLVLALGTASRSADPVTLAVHDIEAGISLAVALGAPLLVASVVVEVCAALVARAAEPIQIHTLLAPMRALGILAVFALVFERIGSVIERAVQSAP